MDRARLTRSAIRIVTLGAMALLSLGVVSPAAAQLTKVKLGTCARTITAGVGTHFAVATKLGYFKQEGIEVEVIGLPGSTDCVKNVATREFDFTIPSVEPLAIGRQQGIRAKYFYTAYQLNTYGIAVPADSPIQKMSDLKGKTIGVINMASASVVITRALTASAGLNPDQDINIVVAGEGAQPAALLRAKQVDALSQFDTQFALVEIAGIKLRKLPTPPEFARYPSNGFIALEETLKNKRKEAVALARGYAKGCVFAMTNPEAAVRILYEVYPQTKPTGKDEETAVRDDVKVLRARLEHMQLAPAGVKRWGENSEANYGAYLDFLLKVGVIKEKVAARDILTNELIDDINKFDENRVKAEAKAYKAGQ
jgi:NitT/TauT family transport system substrate-binding protein